MRNSVGAFENEYWEGTIEQYIDTDVKNNTESKSSIRLNSGNILQNVENLKNGVYNISFNYKKLLELSTIKVTINGVEETLSENGYWKDYEKEITIIDNNFSIKFNSTDNAACLISDLILVPGSKKTYWSQNRNETNTETVKIGEGIQVESSKTNTYHRIDSDGNRTFNKTTENVVSEQTDKGTKTVYLEANGGEMAGLLFQKINYDGSEQSWISGL